MITVTRGAASSSGRHLRIFLPLLVTLDLPMFLRALARRARGFATCWSCDADLPKAVLSCEFCGRIQPLADTRDFFAILKTCVRALVCRANEREREKGRDRESCRALG